MLIGYTTEDPAPEYIKAVRGARNLKELRMRVGEFKEAAPDAMKKVKEMTEEDFKEFQKALPLFKKNGLPHAIVEKIVKEWGVIVMPYKMMLASITADQYKAPWGTAFIRLEELSWNENKKQSSKRL